MEGENLNIFGKNQGEIGSLDKNLVLRTKGRVYVRFGKKYIELLDDKGNLNVKFPKIITKVNSKDEMKDTGFYLIDGNLFINYEGEEIQITGQEGSYVEYGNSQKLTQEQISTVQQNIGLTFKTTKDAQNAITKGIVFIEDKIYFIDSGKIKEIPLNDTLKGINEAGLEEHPSKNNSTIVWTNDKWEFVQIVTQEEFNKYKQDQESGGDESEESEEEQDSMFDPIQYSGVYTLKSFTFDIESSGSSYITPSASFDVVPASELENGDIVILSVSGFWGTRSGTNIAPDTYDVVKTYEVPLSNFNSEDEIRKYAKGPNNEYPDATYDVDETRGIVTIVRTEEELAQGIYTFNMRYKDNKLQFINKNGENVSYVINRTTYQDQKLILLDIDGKTLAFKYSDTAFKGNHLYVKAEASKKEKFKIDYEHAEIALEENYPKDETSNKPKIIPHTVLGDLDDKSEYYNSPAKSFRTYKEKENSQGLYSDQAVFNGAEFRQSLDYKEPQGEEEYSDAEVYNFPRYSKTLNEILCTKHKLEDLEEDDKFKDVIPSIKYLSKFEEYLNQKFEEMMQKIESTASAASSAVPLGTIIMWSYSTIPEEYHICDGSTLAGEEYKEFTDLYGTTLPDLRGKFIVGLSTETEFNTIGKTGGEKEHTLTKDELPSHDHNWFGDDDLSTYVNNWEGSVVKDSGNYDAESLEHDYQSKVYSTSKTGGGQAHNNLPPYYTLYYIIKVKNPKVEEESSETQEQDNNNN